MRRVILSMILILLILTACSPAAATEEPPVITEEPAPTSTPEEETVVEQLAQNLGLEASDITLVSSEETEFADACLGVAMEGVMCAEVITPGRIIILEANGVQYEYHISEDGSRVQPATVALIWKREGGIAGFCDTLTVFRSGEVYSSQCKAQTDGRMGNLASLLSAREQEQFLDWITTYGEVNLDASDPKGVSDRMVITVEFFGAGSKEPTEAEQQKLLEFSQDLYQELAK